MTEISFRRRDHTMLGRAVAAASTAGICTPFLRNDRQLEGARGECDSGEA